MTNAKKYDEIQSIYQQYNNHHDPKKHYNIYHVPTEWDSAKKISNRTHNCRMLPVPTKWEGTPNQQSTTENNEERQ